MSEHGELAKELARLVANYIEGHKGRSLSTLAKAAGVGYTTVRRLAQNEAVPNQETALAIIDVILTNSEKIEFLNRHFPKIGKLVGAVYSDEMDRTGDDALLRHFCSQECHNFIFNVAATKHGTTREQVNRLLGQKGEAALNEMLDSGLLEEDYSGVVRYQSGTWCLTNVGDALEQIKHSVAYFDRELVGTEGASLMHATASVNEAALSEIKNLVREFSLELIKLKDNPNSKGTIPFYTDLIMSLYDKENFKMVEK